MATRLRIFTDVDEGTVVSPDPKVRISLGELLPLIAAAHHNNYAWLRDFLDDDVMVTSDLHEILRAFRSQRRAS